MSPKPTGPSENKPKPGPNKPRSTGPLRRNMEDELEKAKTYQQMRTKLKERGLSWIKPPTSLSDKQVEALDSVINSTPKKRKGGK